MAAPPTSWRRTTDSVVKPIGRLTAVYLAEGTFNATEMLASLHPLCCSPRLLSNVQLQRQPPDARFAGPPGLLAPDHSRILDGWLFLPWLCPLLTSMSADARAAERAGARLGIGCAATQSEVANNASNSKCRPPPLGPAAFWLILLIVLYSSGQIQGGSNSTGLDTGVGQTIDRPMVMCAGLQNTVAISA